MSICFEKIVDAVGSVYSSRWCARGQCVLMHTFMDGLLYTNGVGVSSVCFLQVSDDLNHGQAGVKMPHFSYVAT